MRRRVAETGRHATAWIRWHQRVRTGEHRPCRSVWRYLDRNATPEYRPAISFRRIAELRDGKPLLEVRNAVRLANEGQPDDWAQLQLRERTDGRSAAPGQRGEPGGGRAVRTAATGNSPQPAVPHRVRELGPLRSGRMEAVAEADCQSRHTL